MKKLFLTLTIAGCLCAAASAQQYRTAYFMDEAVMRSYMNPAFHPSKGYINIPVIGDLSLNFNSNALALNNVLYPLGSNGGLVTMLDRRVAWPDIEPVLKNQNKLGVDVHTGLLGAGFYVGDNNFFTVELGLDMVVGANVPKGLVEFVKLGSQSTAYDLHGLSVGTEVLANLALGYSRPINDNLVIGGRLNLKFGLARANVQYDRLNVALSGDRWSIDALGNMAASVVGGIGATYDENGDLDEFVFGTGGGLAGFGASIDVGAEYLLFDRIKLSAAILNVGFMSWSSKTSLTAVAETAYEFTGAQYGFNSETQQWEYQTEGNDFDFDGLMRFRPENSKVRSKVYPGFVLGGEYDIFGDNLLGAGLLFSHRRNQYFGRTEVALSATVNPIDWFTASLSYTVGNYKSVGDNFFNSFGLALNFHPGWIHFFIGTDFMMFRVTPQALPVGQKVFNLTFGLAKTIGKRHDKWL